MNDLKYTAIELALMAQAELAYQSSLAFAGMSSIIFRYAEDAVGGDALGPNMNDVRRALHFAQYSFEVLGVD